VHARQVVGVAREAAGDVIGAVARHHFLLLQFLPTSHRHCPFFGFVVVMVELSLLFEVARLLGASAHHFALSRFAVVHLSSPVMIWF
jgi:hypothetical protein